MISLSMPYADNVSRTKRAYRMPACGCWQLSPARVTMHRWSSAACIVSPPRWR